MHLEAGYTPVKGLRVALQVDNLLDATHSSFGVLGENFFTGPGRTFGPSAGVEPAVEQFRAAGAPRGVWLTLEYGFGGPRAPDSAP